MARLRDQNEKREQRTMPESVFTRSSIDAGRFHRRTQKSCSSLKFRSWQNRNLSRQKAKRVLSSCKQSVFSTVHCARDGVRLKRIELPREGEGTLRCERRHPVLQAQLEGIDQDPPQIQEGPITEWDMHWERKH